MTRRRRPKELLEITEFEAQTSRIEFDGSRTRRTPWSSPANFDESLMEVGIRGASSCGAFFAKLRSSLQALAPLRPRS